MAKFYKNQIAIKILGDVVLDGVADQGWPTRSSCPTDRSIGQDWRNHEAEQETGEKFSQSFQNPKLLSKIVKLKSIQNTNFM